MPPRTASGKKTAVADVEDKLEKQAEKKGLTGRRADAYTFGTLNKIGLKRGSKTTPKGMRAAKPKLPKRAAGFPKMPSMSDAAKLKRMKMPA